jgi:GMP synthase (glutamine-hydrolysing)
VAVETSHVTRVALLPEPTLGAGRRWRIARPGASTSTVLVLRHRQHGEPGRLLDTLAARGLASSVIERQRGDDLPDPSQLRFAVVLGADVTVADVTTGWTADERDWLRAADRAGTPVLGIGSGAEALALALGGGVEPARRPQYGWGTVSTAAPRLIAPGPWLMWTEVGIEVPPRARVLASDSFGPQSFRIGRHLGVHFHPEATPEIVAGWAARTQAPLDATALEAATARHQANAATAARALFSGFVDSVG